MVWLLNATFIKRSYKMITWDLHNWINACSHGKIKHIEQITYYFCNIQHNRSPIAINYIMFLQKSLSFKNKMVLTVEDDTAAAVCIIIILSAIKTRINEDPTRRSHWVCPWIRRRQQFGALCAFDRCINRKSSKS